MSDKPSATDAAVVDIPHDLVNEQVVIASVLTSKKARARLLKKIRPDLFVESDHGVIWSTLRKLEQKKLAFSLPTLHTEMAGKVKIDYMQSLIASYPKPPANLEHHITTLLWDHARSEIVKGPLSDFLKTIRDPSSDPDKVKSLAKRTAKSLDVSLGRDFLENPRLLADRHMIALQKRAQQGVYEYGLGEFDRDSTTGEYRVIPGAAPTKTTLITGVSGSSKSTVGAIIALAQARMGRKVLYGAWEMGSGPTIELLAQMSLYVSDKHFTRYNVSTGQLDDKQLKTFRDRMEEIGDYVRFFDPPFGSDPSHRYTNDDAMDVLHQNFADSGCEVAVLDLWERCIPDGRPEAERRALFRQQQIAVETDMHQILVCQQRLKEVESRPDTRPARDTILGSSAWVDIADTIIGVHRPKNWDTHAPDTLELICLKQRFGPWPFVIEYDWDPVTVVMSDGREQQYEHPSATRRRGHDPFAAIGAKK